MAEYVFPTGLGAIGSEKLTVDATAGGVALTAANYQTALSGNFATKTTAQRAFITVEGYAVRVNVDPSATVTASDDGHALAVGDSLTLTSATQIQNFRAIRTTANSGTLLVTYFL